MADYTSVFGGSTIYPSDVSYLALALDADFVLEWPLNKGTTLDPASRIIDVTASGTHTITLPPADETGPGQTILFNNLPASGTAFYVVDAAGGAVATVGIGEQWQIYLADNATAAGVWRVYRMGASTATVQASALAGYGIVAMSGQLSQSTPVTEFNSSPRTAMLTDRASILVWTGTGAATVNLPAAGTAGNNYFVSFRNAGGGAVTVDPSGAETIDGLSALILNPGDSATAVTNGIGWYTLGLGQDAVFAFDYTVIDLTGETSPYVLSSSELNRVAYSFIGTLTANMVITVPSTTQQYWVSNNTTGAFTLSLSTAGGTPVAVAQGARLILYSNGANVIQANTGNIAIPIPANQGGTGQTTYAVGDLLYADSTSTLAKLSDIAVGNALLSGGVGAMPSYGKIGLTTHVSGVLPLANGGTGSNLADPNDDRIMFWDDSAGVVTWLSLGAGLAITGTVLNGVGTDTQDFASSGTWNKPSGASTVIVEMWGAGGGGASGSLVNGGSMCGGGGGGGGARYFGIFKATDLAASVSVTIGAGGTGGAGQTTLNTAGIAGTAGGNTTFGSYATAYGGGPGRCSNTSSAQGGVGGSTLGQGLANPSNFSSYDNRDGGWPGNTVSAYVPTALSGTMGIGDGGGGGGGSASSALLRDGGGAAKGGAGGGGGGGNSSGSLIAAGAGGSGTQYQGGSSNTGIPLEGGNGGAASNSISATAGSVGGKAAGGGGGGALNASSGTSGAGGAGGAGFCRVITITGV